MSGLLISLVGERINPLLYVQKLKHIHKIPVRSKQRVRVAQWLVKLVHTQDNYLMQQFIFNTNFLYLKHLYLEHFDTQNADSALFWVRIIKKYYLYKPYRYTSDWSGVASCSLTWVKD